MNNLFGWNVSEEHLFRSKNGNNVVIIPGESDSVNFVEIETPTGYSETLNFRINKIWKDTSEGIATSKNILKLFEPDLGESELDLMFGAIENDDDSLSDKKVGKIRDINYDNSNFSFSIEINDDDSSVINYSLAGTELLPNKDKVKWNIEDLPEVDISDIEISVPKTIAEDEIEDNPTVTNNTNYSYSSSSNSSTSSSSSSTSNSTSSSYGDEVPEDIETAIVVVVKQTVERVEHLSGTKWPWSFDDYHINNLGGDMYNTFGQFSHNGYIYNFEMIIFMRPDTSGRVEFYNVY